MRAYKLAILLSAFQTLTYVILLTFLIIWILFVLYMQKLRPWAITCSDPDHEFTKWQIWDLNPTSSQTLKLFSLHHNASSELFCMWTTKDAVRLKLLDTLKHDMLRCIVYCSRRYQNLHSVVGIVKSEVVSYLV